MHRVATTSAQLRHADAHAGPPVLRGEEHDPAARGPAKAAQRNLSAAPAVTAAADQGRTPRCASSTSRPGAPRWRASATCRAYVIFHDATLAAIAERNPASLGELEGISGMGGEEAGGLRGRGAARVRGIAQRCQVADATPSLNHSCHCCFALSCDSTACGFAPGHEMFWKRNGDAPAYDNGAQKGAAAGWVESIKPSCGDGQKPGQPWKDPSRPTNQVRARWSGRLQNQRCRNHQIRLCGVSFGEEEIKL